MYTYCRSEMNAGREDSMKTETWLDVIPTLPLARGVPVVFWLIEEYQHADGPWQGDRGIVTYVEPGRLMISENHAHDAGSFEVDTDVPEAVTGYRVDLDDSQGVAYALTKVPRPVRWVANWMNGKTTDEDRLGIARALREVTP